MAVSPEFQTAEARTNEQLACLNHILGPDKALESLDDLATLPVLRKGDLVALQGKTPPLGGVKTGAITRIFTDWGIVGIGEGSPYEDPAHIKRYTEETIKPLLVGKNPFDVEFLTNRGNDSRRSRAPWAGIDNACWDIIGKAKNLPVYQLLATANEPVKKIKIYASAGVEHEWYNDGEQFLIEEALRYKEAGLLSLALVVISYLVLLIVNILNRRGGHGA